MNCEFCQSPAHVWFQCPKKPEGWKPVRLAKGSTAALMEVPRSSRGQPFARGKHDIEGAKAIGDIGSSPRPPAGTQALPVDTNPSATNEGPNTDSFAAFATSLAGVEGDKTGANSRNSSSRLLKGSSGVGLASPACTPDVETANTKGAHKFDKVAYQREYMRKRRAKAKEVSK